MKIYPVRGGEGLRDPRTRRIIPAEGLEVEANSFWLRRLAQGDVTSEPAPSEATERPAQTDPSAEQTAS